MMFHQFQHNTLTNNEGDGQIVVDYDRLQQNLFATFDFLCNRVDFNGDVRAGLVFLLLTCFPV
jgi:hypothetical protein